MSRNAVRRAAWTVGALGVALITAVSAVTPAASAATTPAPTVTTSPTAVPAPATLVAGTPTITGTARYGATLTAKPGTWSPTPTFAYQWRINGVAVAGATNATWVIGAAAVGKTVTVSVTGSRTGYTSVTKTSAATATIAAASLTTADPKISGTPTLGLTLTAVPGSWGPSPVTFGYQWLRGTAVIAGATKSTYVPVAADLGQSVSVRVTGTKSGYGSVTKTTSAVTIGRPFTATAPSTINGTVAVGKQLTAAPGTWSPAPVTLNYQWYRGTAKISGATARTYTLVKEDAGQKVSVRTTGVKSGYTTTTRETAGVSVPRVLTVPASVSFAGTATVGTKLTARPGEWGPSPVTLAYQWLRDGQPIAGATASTYTLVNADAARKISVRVTGSKSGYTTVAKTSATADVKYAFTASPTPVINGTAAAGRVLTLATGTWTPAPVTLQVQWRIDGYAISGATGKSYTVPSWAAGRSVTATVTATKSGYLTLTRTAGAKTVSWSIGNTLRPGTSMRPGAHLTSPNGVYTFGLQGDGNVVLAKGTTPLRTSRTTGTLSPMLALQEGGALALYDGAMKTVWSSGTSGRAISALTLNDDGTLTMAEIDGLTAWNQTGLAVFNDASAPAAGIPARNGWAYPIRPSASMTTYDGHSGDDFPAATGTPIYAMRGGKVTTKEEWITSGCPVWAPNNTKQKDVVIETVIDGTTFKQTYSHLSSFSVQTGQTVKAGQKIGEVGSTGCSTGPHLHLAFTVDGVRYALYPRDVLGVSKY